VAATANDIINAVELMNEETSRLTKAPSNRTATAAPVDAEGTKKKRANKTLDEEALAGTKKKKVAISRSASVRVPSKASKEKEKMSKTTVEVSGKDNKATLKRTISVRGRKKAAPVLEDVEEEDSSVVEIARRVVNGKTAKELTMKNKQRNKTVQEVLLENEDEEMDVTEANAASDTNNNNNKGSKRKNETAIKRVVSFKQPKSKFSYRIVLIFSFN